jgi:6-phosphogluconolactonase
MSVTIHRAADPAQAARDCALWLAASLRSAIEARDRATLAVSGGTTPALLFDALVPLALDWSRLHVFFVDERPVPPGDAQSNYTLCERHLLTPARVPPANVHRIAAELGPERAAARYAAGLAAFFALAPGQIPRFDAVQCGIGADCHTASLFPGEPLIADRASLVAALPVAKLAQTRITLLPAVLLAARDLAILACGPDKHWALDQALHAPLETQRYPAQLLTQLRAGADLFADIAALPDR